VKLILCKRCLDVLRLRHTFRACACGAAWGIYRDELNAEIGGQALPLGFQNSSFVEAIRNQPASGQGERFVAFVIPKQCPTIEVSL
jgi:hypothetical protein